MLKKLDFIESKYEELSIKIGDPEVIENQNKWRKLCIEHSELEDLVVKYREYKKTVQEVENDKEMLQDKEIDKEFKELVEEELKELECKKEEIEEELKLLLIPKDPNDDKNVFIEIRAGAGGEEAALFGAVLFRMYTRYAEGRGWGIEIMSINETDIGGLKEAVFMIKGKGAYSRFKYESGTHRVQRVPDTESSGRVHTSTATVAVLPEVEEVDIEINQNDLRIDVFRATGHGGQHVNTTDSAVRITHIPTGVVVSCQDEKSQHKNKDKAMKVLRARLYDKAEEERHQSIAEDRKNQIGTGDRSERIRTYNYPQSRITDHRIGLTLYKLESFLDGDMDEIIDSLITANQTEKMKEF